MTSALTDIDTLFFKEEIKSEILINKIRLFLILIFTIVLFTNIPSYGRITVSNKLAIWALSFAFLYSIVLYFILKKGLYKSFIKYISITLDISLVAITLIGYQFSSPSVQPEIFAAARSMIFFLLIILTGLRYSFAACIWAGIVASVMYFLATTVNYKGGNFFNPMFFTNFNFISPIDNKTYQLKFHLSNEIYKPIYLFLAALITAFISKTSRKLLTTGVKGEGEKNLLRIERKMLSQSEREQKMYLKNIGQGLLCFRPNLIIREHHSAIVRPMFGKKRIDGIRFPKFIFGDNKTAIKDLKEFIDIAFTNTSAEYEMIEAINPISRLKYEHPDGTTKYFTFIFKRVYQQEKVIELMAIVDDITHIVETENKYALEKKKHLMEIEQISAILQLQLSDFEEFLKEGHDVITRSKDLLNLVKNNPDTDITDNVTVIFRLTHTMKGNASNFKFHAIEGMAHKAEDFFADLRDKNTALSPEDLEKAEENLTALEETFENLLNLKEKFSSFSQSSVFNANQDPNSSLKTYFGQLQTLCTDMGKSLHKKISFNTNVKVDRLPLNLVKIITGPVNHLVRNAADHALENPEERTDIGKKETGSIHFEINEQDQNLLVILRDDGRGINTEKIYKKAIDRGMINEGNKLSHGELIQILFKPGFSTKDDTSHSSGRGVGLDAVKDMVTKHGGKVGVKTAANKGTEFSLIFPKTTFTWE